MNSATSEILTFNIPKKEALAYQKDFPFVWGKKKKELKYLGVKITSRETLYQINFISLLNKIKTELNKIPPGQLSWGGRINIFKMVILPKILYKMQMLLIPLPLAFFETIQTVLSRFIWRGKKTQIKMTQLTRDKARGGWGAPDIRNYYYAITMSRLIEWVKNKEKRWVEMECTISTATLGNIVWIPAQYRNLSKDTHIITRNALKIWDNMHKKEGSGNIIHL